MNSAKKHMQRKSGAKTPSSCAAKARKSCPIRASVRSQLQSCSSGSGSKFFSSRTKSRKSGAQLGPCAPSCPWKGRKADGKQVMSLPGFPRVLAKRTCDSGNREFSAKIRACQNELTVEHSAVSTTRNISCCNSQVYPDM